MAKKQYRVATAHGTDFKPMCESLLDKIGKEEKAVRLVFFGSPGGNGEYLAQLDCIKKCVAERFAAQRPVVTYVAQKPLVGQLKMEIAAVDPAIREEVDIRYGDHNYMVLEDRTGRELIIGGILPDDMKADALTQSRDVFRKIGAIMEKEKFPVNSITRQWNYIERITDFNGERQHYQDFNDARSHFYAQADWSETGYPAATGIGTQLGGIMVELNALIKGEGIFNLPLDNSLQIAAHCYSQQVLLGAEDAMFKEKTTPKFERARIVGFPDNATVYISGTAAIRGEESVQNDITEQTRITMENIDFLTSPENINAKGEVVDGKRTLRLLRIYIKNPEHLDPVRDYMNAHYGEVAKFYLYADVCRDELLIEMEGIADIG